MKWWITNNLRDTPAETTKEGLLPLLDPKKWAITKRFEHHMYKDLYRDELEKPIKIAYESHKLERQANREAPLAWMIFENQEVLRRYRRESDEVKAKVKAQFEAGADRGKDTNRKSVVQKVRRGTYHRIVYSFLF